ncbi:hypothetical protein DFH09DRAFT_1181490 [Mycena vulgaris]|nr:hypothetical protein DFH09DRAFT_1181490 [Mycena vulgaris]
MSSPGDDPTLPEDLERLIFELATFLFPEAMPALLLVAQRVKTWIEPLLYEIIYDGFIDPRPERTLPKLCEMIQSRPASFFQDHVRHVCLRGWDDDDYIVKILAVCGATVNLNLFLFDGGPAFLSIIGVMPLQRLSINLALLFPGPNGDATDFSYPLFTHITHLDLHGWNDDDWAAWSGLAHMPMLTHLSFNNNLVSSSVCRSALVHCTSLKVLAIVCSDEPDLVIYARFYGDVSADTRFVMVVVTDALRDWEMGARGGEDYWVAAEALVQKRRSGVYKGQRLTLF